MGSKGNKEPFDYGFTEDGLRMQVVPIRRSGDPYEALIHRRDLTPFSHPSDEFTSRYDAAQKALRQAGPVSRRGRTAIQAAVLNPNAASGRTLFAHLPWMDGPGELGGAHRLAVSAAIHPDTRIIAVYSPRLTGAEARQLRRSGSYSGHAARFVEGLAPYAKDGDKVALAGESRGGREAMAVAAIWPDGVDELRIFDAPGSRQLGIWAMARAMGVTEAKHTEKYTGLSPDARSREIQARFDTIYSLAGRFAVAAFTTFDYDLPSAT